MRIVVIGSGFGGLSAAIRLQAQGHDVTIVEKLDKPGGRAYVFEQDGFTFDAGPTIVTARWVFDELFALTRRTTEDYVQLVPVNPFYNVRFEDGSVFHYNGDKAELIRQVREFSPGDVAGYEKFRAKSWSIFNIGMPLIDKPFLTLGSMIKALPDLIRTRADRSLASLAEQYIRDPRLRQVFSFHPLFVGGNPYATSSVYALIHKLEQQWGVLFPMGGMGALVRGLVQAFEDLGGTIRYESEVEEILVDDAQRTTGVRRAGGEPPCAVRGEGLPTCVQRTRLLLRDGREALAVRVHALDAPAVLRELGRDGPRAVRLDLPSPRRLFRLDGTQVGDAAAASFELRLDPWSALILEVRP